MIFKKSIILSSIDNSLKKAVLNIDGKSGDIRGDVKLYNFGEEPMGVLTIAFLIDGKVSKVGLTRVGYMTYDYGTIFKTIPQNCTVALISSRSGNSEPLLLGTTSGKVSAMEERLVSSLGVLDETNSKKIEETLNINSVKFDDDEDIEKEIDDYLYGENCCKSCNYKKYFYEKKIAQSLTNSLKSANNEHFQRANNIKQQNYNNTNNKSNFYETSGQNTTNNLSLNNESKPIERIEIENKNTQEEPIEREIQKGQLRKPEQNSNIYFINEIGGQIDLLFAKYPPEQALNEIIPNSKWVKIDFENNDKNYVVGLIYENNEVKYVCYGIPARFSKEPPADFNKQAQWLPLDLDDFEGEGYWITYQDAKDGELIKVEIV